MRKKAKHLFPLAVVMLCIGIDTSWMSTLNAQTGKSVVYTRHNLSVSGPGPIKAVSEERICIFCHAPRKKGMALPFLWNRKNKRQTYTPYRSSTIHSTVGQPSGASRVCLSCHDGTIALGQIASKPTEVTFVGGIRFMPPGRPARLGTDLSDDHPVSFVYDTGLASKNPELADPSVLPPQIKLDKNKQLQCTACHDPHDDTFGKFLVMPNGYSNLCTACHVKEGWTASSHAQSLAPWNGLGTDPWPNTDYQTVAENGCENCHRPHTAKAHERLLKHAFEEDNCLVCHNGNVASKNIERELTKPYGHFVQDYTRVHDPAEDFASGRVRTHVECDDCHNSHQANDLSSQGSLVASGPNKGASGIDTAGRSLPRARYLYEICFKCHADNNMIRTLPITRQIDQLNTRLEFDPANPSFHPVETSGANPDVPSLLAPLTTNSIISCTDCHNTDDPAGPEGPHGSSYRFILARNYETDDFTRETSDSYDLCYKCHSRNRILADQSFKKHKKHVLVENAPCALCHDPHGISNAQGNPANNSHLINFELTAVSPDSMGRLRFEDLGAFKGRCFLTCHGVEHNPKEYGD